MASQDEIFAKVKAMVAEILGINPDQIEMESGFMSLGTDSLTAVEIIMKAEEVFGVDISEDEARQFTAVVDLVDFVSRRI